MGVFFPLEIEVINRTINTQTMLIALFVYLVELPILGLHVFTIRFNGYGI